MDLSTYIWSHKENLGMREVSEMIAIVNSIVFIKCKVLYIYKITYDLLWMYICKHDTK